MAWDSWEGAQDGPAAQRDESRAPPGGRREKLAVPRRPPGGTLRHLRGGAGPRLPLQWTPPRRWGWTFTWAGAWAWGRGRSRLSSRLRGRWPWQGIPWGGGGAARLCWTGALEECGVLEVSPGLGVPLLLLLSHFSRVRLCVTP